MELCPKCRTALYLKDFRDDGTVVKTCRNKSCMNFQKDVAIERPEPSQEPEKGF